MYCQRLDSIVEELPRFVYLVVKLGSRTLGSHQGARCSLMLADTGRSLTVEVIILKRSSLSSS